MNVALILAKKNSSGLPGKNILRWKGKTLLEHTINHLKNTRLFSDIYVSSNCKIIHRIAKKLGCKTIVRNNKLAKNKNYVESVNHACKIIKNFKTITLPMVVQPVREYKIFKKMLNHLKKPDIDSVVTVENFDSSTAWIYKTTNNKIYKIKNIDYSNDIARRHDLVILNNAVVSFKYSSWKKSKGITPWPYLGSNIYYIKQKKLNKNLKIDINDLDDKKWFYKITNLLKWKKLY